jgi:hypothetical protein
MRKSKEPELMFVAFQIVGDDDKEFYLLFGGAFLSAEAMIAAAKDSFYKTKRRAKKFAAYGKLPLNQEEAKGIFICPEDKKKIWRYFSDLPDRTAEKEKKRMREFFVAIDNIWDADVARSFKYKYTIHCFGLCKRPPRKKTTSTERREQRKSIVDQFARLRRQSYRRFS